MTDERTMHADVRSMLINNDPFDYCHLIKFERPSRPDSRTGKVSTSKERYAYVTDASRDMNFDDLSASLSGVANGVQKYRAQKVVKVSSVTEEVEAKASTFNLVLDGTAIGAEVSATVTTSVVSTGVYDIVFPSTTDLLEEGFREGDKVNITGISAPGAYNIEGFRANNTLRISKIDTTLVAQTGVSITMSLASEEITSILMDKNDANYSSFLNREVFIWKAFYDDDSQIVGEPLLIFKGLISNCSFDDDDSSIKVNWGLSSHWGDWAQVNGRVTSDDFHRALDEDGNPNPLSTLKPLYAYDKGFMHGETSLNLLAKYVVAVEKQKLVTKKQKWTMSLSHNLFGRDKISVKKYIVNEDRNTELDFQLVAKALPVIYGVRPTGGIPIFADTLVDDPATVYVVYALGEGEFGAIYDVYIEGNSLICGNKADSDARSVQTSDNTIPLVCRGRADRGDVLGGAVATTGTPSSYYSGANDYLLDFNYNMIDQINYVDYVEPTTEAAPVDTGLLDGQTLTISAPQNIVIDFFSGKQAQKAAASLVNLAQQNKFKVQTDYWAGTDTAEYWGPNHRLLDTAYIVLKVKIAEGETTIPELDFIVKAKVLPCYNYDYSYSQYDKASGESAANFVLGQAVTLKRSDTSASIGSVYIIDKWTFYNPDGTANVRFRFGDVLGNPIEPALGYVDGVPAITKFFMESGANTWTMVTYNHKETSGTVGAQLSSPLSSATNSGGYVRFNYTANTDLVIGGDPDEPSPKYSVVTSALELIENDYFGSAILSGTDTSTTLTTGYDWTKLGGYASAAASGGNLIVSRNTIKLAAGASAVNDFYNGYDITVTRTNATTGKQVVQTKSIIDYDGTSKIATIDGVWDIETIPNTSDTYYVSQAYADSRVSTNFAIHTMDYAQSVTYGKGLSLANDMYLPSWLDTARRCDTRSDVTIRLAAGVAAPSVGDLYKWPSSGNILFQGLVSSVYTGVVAGTTTTFVVFTNVLGKFTNQWNSWKSYPLNTLVYNKDVLYKVTSAGIKTTEPTHTSGTTNGLEYSSTISLTKVSGSGLASLGVFVAGNPVQGLRNGRYASGYSLYDCDGVDYWKYVGWESHDQRWVTKHQGNIAIDTSSPVFENTNMLLSHFGGILRYSGGRYHLDLEETAPSIDNTDDEPYNIQEKDIIGKIRLSDEGIRNSYNSLSASYSDPSNRFEARSVNFFNSDYLKIDRNVPKKGNLGIPGITNYYNARLLAGGYLNRSRFGLAIALTIAPRGMLLVPGRVMQLQYPRYGWTNKKFRIESVQIADDCLVEVTAREYDDSFYSTSHISKQMASGQAGLPITAIITPPTSLTATELLEFDDTSVSINLNWTNSATGNASSTSTEIYHYSPDLTITTIASNVATTSADHELVPDDIVVPMQTGNGLTAGTTYWVDTVPANNTFTLKNAAGTVITLTNGTSLVLKIGKQKLLTTADYPTVRHVDIVYSTNSIEKYYRIRHKVVSSNNSGVSTDQYSEYEPTLASTAILGASTGFTIPTTTVIDLGEDDESIHLDGTPGAETILHAGAADPVKAPVRILFDGTFEARKFNQRNEAGELYWSSADGLTDVGYNDMFARNKSSLPTTATITGTVNNLTSAPSGTTAASSYKGVYLGADSTVQLSLEYIASGFTSPTDGFPSALTFRIYERYSTTTDFSSSTWSALGSPTTFTKTVDYTPSLSVSREFDPLYSEWSAVDGYSLDGVTLAASVTAAAKVAGYYQYAVYWTGSNSSLAFSTSVLKATDTDDTPSFIIEGVAATSVNFVHPLGTYSNIYGKQLTSGTTTAQFSVGMIIIHTAGGLPRTVRNLGLTTVDLSSTGVGKLDTGVRGANTWYYIYLISNGTTDALLASLSETTPTLPSGYSYSKLIGTLKTNTSSNIVPFVQVDNEFTFVSTATDTIPYYNNHTGDTGITATSAWTGASILFKNVWISKIAVTMTGTLCAPGGTVALAATNTHNGRNVSGANRNPPPFSCNSSEPIPFTLTLHNDYIIWGANSTDPFMRIFSFTMAI